MSPCFEAATEIAKPVQPGRGADLRCDDLFFDELKTNLTFDLKTIVNVTNFLPQMLRYLLGPSGKPCVEQIDTAPSVYLDHWALRKISTDPLLADCLVTTLQKNKGTLLLSWLHLEEFSSVTNRSHAIAAEQLVERLLPQVFFLEPDPFTVIGRENTLMAGGSPLPPHSDPDFLETFVHLRPSTPRPFTTQGLFTSMQTSGQDLQLKALAAEIVQSLEKMRIETHANQQLHQRVLRLPTGTAIQHGTRLLLRELTRTFLLNTKLVITENHAIDLIHAVVPSAYADFVLLDKHWRVQVDQARNRLLRAGLNIPVASVYSEKSEGIPKFFAALASWCHQTSLLK